MMHSGHHYQVKRDGTVLERGTLRGKVEQLGGMWQAIDAESVCDDVRYYTRTSAALSLLVGCLYGMHDGPCSCR